MQDRTEEAMQAAAAAEEKQKKSSPERTLAIVLASIAGLLVLLVVAAGGFLLYSRSLHGNMFSERSSEGMQQLREQQAAAATPEPSPTPILADIDADWIDSEGRAWRYKDNVVTVLLMGVDNMWKRHHWTAGTVSNGGNADVLALAVLDLDRDSLQILYIPRDTMTNVVSVDQNGNYEDMIFTNISTAHSYGDGGELSCELTAQAVSNLLYGVHIDRYAAVNMDAINIVNSYLGGVELALDRDYTDIYYTLKEGSTVRLDNWLLQKMLRYRDKSEINGAYDRGLRDLKILRAMFEQFKVIVKEDPGVTLKLVKLLDGYLRTNLTLDEISFIAQRVIRLQLGDKLVVSLKGENRAGEQYVEFYPDEQWLHDYVAETFFVPAQ